MCVVLKMLHVIDNDALTLTFRMGARYFAVAFEGVNVILDVPPERVLLAKYPCTVFESESSISNAEETL